MVEFTFILNVGSVVNDVGFFKKLLVIFDVALVSFFINFEQMLHINLVLAQP